MYSDEVTPGNVLAPLPSRKCWAIYCSCKEFGPALLSKENAWFCMCVQRTSSVKTLVAGIVQVFGLLLKMMFLANGTHFQHTGIYMASETQEIRLHDLLYPGWSMLHTEMSGGSKGMQALGCACAAISSTPTASSVHTALEYHI